jgi:beta-glucosidase
MALAATWNTSLLREVGNLMGYEAIAKGVHVLLGPAVNMQRESARRRKF